jgi:hypothetical protein
MAVFLLPCVSMHVHGLITEVDLLKKKIWISVLQQLITLHKFESVPDLLEG